MHAWGGILLVGPRRGLGCMDCSGRGAQAVSGDPAATATAATTEHAFSQQTAATTAAPNGETLTKKIH